MERKIPASPRRGQKRLAGVYGAAMKANSGFCGKPKIRKKDFAEGRRPPPAYACGKNGSGRATIRGAKVIATAFAVLSALNVDVGPLFQTLPKAAQDARGQ